MIRNNLFLHRLRIITEKGEVAYDEVFHKGVNIIRGDNSSGKSTITHFIFFALGGAFKDFVPEAYQCKEVYAEIEMNGGLFTIKRNLLKGDKRNINDKAPMFFFWGKLDESLNPPVNKRWMRYGYNTTSEKKSFSNVLFDNIGFPEVKGYNNITFHQILRLLYVDQESPTSSLFYYEHFDSQITRETVADLLLGIYNEELYENKKRLILANKELDNIRSEIRVTEKFFSDPSVLSPSSIKNKIENSEKEISNIQQEVSELKLEMKTVEYNTKSKLEFQTLKEEAIKQRNVVSELKDSIESIRYEIRDSDYFIYALERKIEALRNSIQTREFLGNLPIEYCPECLSEIKKSNDSSKCKLCKESIDESYGVIQARRRSQEIDFQIKESKKLQEINNRSLLEQTSRYEKEALKLTQIQRQVNQALNDVKSYKSEVLQKLYVQKGFLKGEILQSRKMLENAELYQKLHVKKAELEKEIKYLKDFIRNTEKGNARLKEQINKRIRAEGVYLLNNDFDRQDEFKNANEFFIDFSNNITFLSNKHSKYSASSNFYLKVSARFAIFLASLSVDGMRYPRFIFADNMEDKGIELERAQNFQKILINRVSQYDENSFQIIYTTSYITPELNDSSYVVGEYYSKENPSLKNINK